MKKIENTEFQSEYKNKRDSYNAVATFLRSNDCYDGQIFVIYGLRRTGKTTIMEQAYNSCGNSEECSFYEMQKGDDFNVLDKAISEDKKRGVKYFFVDEITRLEDIADNICLLPDIYAKEGLRIVVSGTDSLGFVLAENDQLFGRTIRVNTTYIPFAEHSRVLGTNDIDDYIKYGGLMKKGEPHERFIHDYDSMCKYVDNAVSENISNSLIRNPQNSNLSKLSLEEIKAVIEKMVELYSGKLNTKIANNLLNTVSLNEPLKFQEALSKIENQDVIDRLVYERKNIVRDFSSIINADVKTTTFITDEMIDTLEGFLLDLDVLSVTARVQYSKTDELGWRASAPVHDYYVIQPAIKYYHLVEALNFIDDTDYYQQLSQSGKIFIKQKLTEVIKGYMVEQIILFETSKILPKTAYIVRKPEFFIDGKKKGEYDMLVYDKNDNQYWCFEIKHTNNPFSKQCKHLENTEFKEIMDYHYGKRAATAVLYRGTSFKTASGTVYLNISDYLKAIYNNKDMNKAIQLLAKDLVVRDLKAEEHQNDSIQYDS